jgi:apolipoprotein N-acyltransferase
MRHLILSLLSGVLLALAWPTYGIPQLLFFAFVPLLIVVYERRATQKKSGWLILGLSYLSFFIWNIVSTYWLYYSTPFGMWFAVLVNTLLMALVFLIYYKITKRLDFKKSSLFLVLLWISFEYLHLQWEFSWPWLNLGNAFAEYTSWIQWYEYTGTFGGTLWVWIGNFIVFKATLLYLKYKETKLIVNGAVKLLACIAVPLIISIIILKTYEESTQKAEVVILQPNIDPYNEKYNITDTNIQTLLTTLADERVTDSTALVLAPETVFADNTPLSKISYSPAYQFGKTMVSKHYKLSVLSGISMYDYFTERSRVTPQSNSHPKGGWFDDYNSAYMMNTSRDIQLYHKSKLVVGVENFPYQGLLKPLLGDVMLDLGGTVAMKTTQADREAFTLNYNIKTAPIICYESIYGEFVTGYVRNGAQFLSIITNDAWWSNTQGHKQHFNYARLRAIETRRSIARSANTGISGFITETGEVLETLEYEKQGSIKGTVTLNDSITFYVKYGDFIARTSAFVLVFLFLYAITRRRGEV